MSVRVSLSPFLATNDYATILKAARSDMGDAEVPKCLLRTKPGLVRALLAWTLSEASIQLFYASDRMLSKTVRAVLDEVVASVPAWLRA